MWTVISTWPFSLNPAIRAGEMVLAGESAMDAAVAAATMVEDDPSVDSVGYGGLPNADGEVELDGAVMDGVTMRMGAVAAVRGYRNPARIAREVLRDTPHCILAGDGAERFAARHGFIKENLLTKDTYQKWLKIRETEALKPYGHDTVGVIVFDQKGGLAVALSTSGLTSKVPGRVGDSPIIGSGFYADITAGAAAATGVGEDIMRGVTSYAAVEFMRAGLPAPEAARRAVLRTRDMLLRAGSKPCNIAVICADTQGGFGGAANHNHFAYAAGGDASPVRLHPCDNPGGEESIWTACSL